MKLDLGCGKNKREGFLGVDSRPFDGVDYVWDLRSTPWRLCNIEYADANERVDGEGAAITVALADGKYAEKEWPIIGDSSVEEAHSSHFIEHLTAPERIRFVNELHRVLVPGGKCQLIAPHFASCRAYGDLTHQWPPVSEFWFYYLSKDWRAVNAPHNDGYTCDFDATWGYSLHPQIVPRNQDYQQHALQFFKEAAQDIICTLTARK